MNYKSLIMLAASASLASGVAVAAQISPAKLNLLEKQVAALQNEVKTIQKDEKGKTVVNTHFTRDTESTVVIAPFTAKPTYYSGGQLVTSAPSINEDSKLLYRRYLDGQQFGKEKSDIPRPRLVLSGQAAGTATYTNPYTGRYSTDIDLSGAELDAFAEITPWVNGFMTLNYDNGVADNSTSVATTTSAKSRISNSRFYLDKGFITVGNFAKSGMYGSIGQMYVPFGRYNGYMISDPLTKFIGKTRARAITFNYIGMMDTFSSMPYAHIFLLKGDTTYGKHSLAKNYGADVGIKAGDEKLHGEGGVSYIANIADSQGMQNNGAASGFRGFEKTQVTTSEALNHAVPGGSLYGNVAYGPYSLVAEYITAMTHFGRSNLTFNGHGAKPRAFDVQAAYGFTLLSKHNSIALGYDRSYEALGLNIPEKRLMATWEMDIMQNVATYLEAKDDLNYGSRTTAGGQTAAFSSGTALGKRNLGVTAKIAVYF